MTKFKEFVTNLLVFTLKVILVFWLWNWVGIDVLNLKNEEDYLRSVNRRIYAFYFTV